MNEKNSSLENMRDQAPSTAIALVSEGGESELSFPSSFVPLMATARLGPTRCYRLGGRALACTPELSP